jgi:uncharacterized low-complexity protein
MRNIRKTPFAIALSAGLLPLTATIAHAESNPFALDALHSAYMQTAEAQAEKPAPAGKMKDSADGGKKAMEGKCAANKANSGAPADASKAMDGSCGANKK